MDLQSKVGLGVSLLSAVAFVYSAVGGVESYFERRGAYNELFNSEVRMTRFENADERMGRLGFFALVSSVVGFSGTAMIRSDEEEAVEE
nr:hypothetical protein [uncultured archaeon]AQS34286.1 hypothetical protein [uncultured archaeon]AQS34745.1 hypothetical protein [uncultured archaeon]